jgi:hypothetical protein
MRVTAIGWRAHAALTATGGRAEIVASLSRSVYAEAAGELVWIGPPGSPLHPRAVIASAVTSPAVGAPVRLVLDGIAPWRPPALSPPFIAGPVAARTLRAVISELGEPHGLGVLLVRGGPDDLVTTRARPYARRLAEACATNDAAGVVAAGRGLLGLGAGLTPSGDDFVGGALFARRLLAIGDSAWEEAVAQIVTEAAAATHPISTRLLADLAAGEGWAPLHDLAAAIAGKDSGTALRAARALTTLGHTSGWDVLAGFSAALGIAPSA